MRRILRIEKSERGIFEPVLSEEDVLGQIRNWLEVVLRARVFRAIERIPKCMRDGCGHYASAHKYGICRKCSCGQFVGTVSEPGTPDLSGYIFDDRFVPVAGQVFPFWLEIKRPDGGRKRPAQVARIELIQQDGGCAAFVKSLDEVRVVLKQHGVMIPEV